MRVHLHTLCWNDAAGLESFFRHYSPWVQRFFIHDDGSDDGSLEILEARPDVTLERLELVHADSWVLSAKHIYDTSWQRSQEEADWIVVTNIDEHLHHPDMAGYLARMFDAGVSAIPALGYQMIDRNPARPGSLLRRDHPFGAPWRNMSKLQIFRPGRIRRTDFAPGRHKVDFDGEVTLPRRDEVVNLHYKYLGLEETFARHRFQAERLGPLDRARGWGHKYHWTRAEYAADFESFARRAVNTSEITDHHAFHAEPRWWRERDCGWALAGV